MSLSGRDFIVMLGMKHDPCPFLNSENKCDIYDVRPTNCAKFPQSLFMIESNHLEAYSEYSCLRDAEPREKEMEIAWKIDEIATKEVELTEREIFGKFQVITVMTHTDMGRLAYNAIKSQNQRDPAGMRKSTRELHRAFDHYFGELLDIDPETGIPKNKSVEVNEFRVTMNKFLYSALSDEISGKLSSVEGRCENIFGETSAKYFELLEELDKQTGI